MGKIVEFNINLHANRQVFYPGEQLTGEVILNLIAPMEMQAIKIECQGKGYCHWTESSGTGSDKTTSDYYGREELFEYKICLFGSTQGSCRVVHPAGRYAYPFTFTLPQVLPSSFESTIGYIRYELKGEIDKPWKFDHKVKRPFVVNEVIDTNQPAFAKGPGGDSHKEVGCLCCAAGPLDVFANIDRGAYCPGEIILINSQVQNHTTRDMAGVKAKLKQIITYYSQSSKKRVENLISKITGAGIPKGDFATWSNQPFGIPATPPSIGHSKVVTVEYMLEVQVDVPWGVDLEVKMPFVMGTVPFRGTYGQPLQYGLPQEQEAPQGNFAPAAGAAAPSQLLGYPDMTPPSYAAAVGMKPVNIGGTDDKHTRGELSYMPVYTFAQPFQGQVPAGAGAAPPFNPQYPPPQAPPQVPYPPMQGQPTTPYLAHSAPPPAGQLPYLPTQPPPYQSTSETYPEKQ